MLRRRLLLACALLPCTISAVRGALQPQPADTGDVLLLASPVSRDLSTGDTHRHRLDLAAGDYVRIAVTQIGIDVGASLLDPGGVSLIEIAQRRGGVRMLSAVATSTGSHSLRIRALETEPVTGRYVVEVTQWRPATAADRLRTRAVTRLIEADGLCAEGRGDATARCLDVYRLALEDWTAAADPDGVALALERMGAIYFVLGKPEEADTYLRRALSLSREANAAESECTALNAIARVLVELGRMDEAAEHAQRALNRSRQTGNRSAEAEGLNALGDVYMFTGRSVESLALYEQARSISEGLRDRRGTAQALLNLGYTRADLSQMTEAQAAYETALSSWRTLGDLRGQAQTLKGLAQLHGMAGERDQALFHYRRANTLFESLGDRLGQASVLSGLGVSHFQLGEADTALGYFRAADELWRNAKDPVGEAANLLPLGLCLTSLGRHREALAHLEHALVIVRAIADRRLEARALEHLGRVYADEGQLEKALDLYAQSMSLTRTVGDRRGEAYALNSIGELLHRLGRNEEASQRLGEALRLGQQSRDRFLESQALYGMASIDSSLGRTHEALPLIRSSVALVETLRTDVASLDLRASLLASMRRRYELEVDLLMRLHDREPQGGYLVQAFEASERSRARSMLDGLAQARTNVREGVDPVLLEQETSLRRSLHARSQRLMRLRSASSPAEERVALEREIDALTASYRQAEAQIRAESPRYAALTQPQPLGLRDVQRLVVDRTSVLLQYFLGEERSYVWAVTPDDIAGYALPPRTEIERLVGAYREALTRPAARRRADGKTASRDAELSVELGRLLLGPVSAHLGGARVLVVADGALHSLPFAALPCPGIDGEATPPLPLLAAHEVVYLPSASTLPLIRGEWHQARTWRKDVIIFADPVFEADDPRLAGSGPKAPKPGTLRAGPERPVPLGAEFAGLQPPLRDVAGFGQTGIPRLLETRQEARRIAALVRSADVALDFDASRATALSSRLADYRVVHFATHGIVDNVHPGLSGVVLSLFDARGQPQDGFLRLDDVYNLSTPADLVVISACSGALGKEIAGEGLIGLVRGFMYAGSRRVVASLWKVDDEATGELMTRFYRGMFEKGLPPPAALRAAQLEIAAGGRWSHPFYWAAFVLQGDWN